jgi:Tfp pilus assembly PilM family ATPase
MPVGCSMKKNNLTKPSARINIFSGLKNKKKKYIFVVQVSEDNLKVVKCLHGPAKRKEIIAFDSKTFNSSVSDENLAGILKESLKQLEYNNHNLLLSLARAQATCRYVKLPATNISEIEKIIPYQVSKYLPYPPQELISAYQLISSDKEGYSHINLNIVHKSTIQRYLNLLNSAGVKRFNIVLSSFGLCNLYSLIGAQELTPVLLVDIDLNYAELAIVLQKKLLFSRSFKIIDQKNLKPLLSEEIKKTINTYIKETGLAQPQKGVILSDKAATGPVPLADTISMPVNILNYLEKTNCAKAVVDKVKETGRSLANLIGLSAFDISDSLNLLPQEFKDAAKKDLKQKETIKSAVFMALALVMLATATIKNFDNKKAYLARLKAQIGKISQEAKSLEETEKRLSAFQSRNRKNASTLDIIYELHRLMPKDVYLTNLLYEEDKQISLRGQSEQLNSVLSLVEGVENAKPFSGYNVKVKYATKKKTALGEAVDFEITCVRTK